MVRGACWALLLLFTGSALGLDPMHPFSKTPSKIDPRLLRVVSDAAPGSESGVQGALLETVGDVRVNGAGEVQVYIAYARKTSDPNGRIAAFGFREELHDREGHRLQGWLPLGEMTALAAQEFVLAVRVPDYARTKVGSVTSEGDAIVDAPALRELGFSGAGVRVGVISDGIDHIGEAQASGDAPPQVAVIVQPGGGDEGTAMIEIIHDIAPDAELAFCGVQTSLEFLLCIEALQSEFAADVIVDDLGFLQEPFFEDGPLALAVADAVTNGGVVYVSAAGNDALRHYQATFRGSGELGFARNDGTPIPEHNFGIAAGEGSDPTMTLAVPAGVAVTVVLQWNDPFGRSANDYDLLLADGAGNLIAVADAIQDGDDDPIELAAVLNDSDQTLTLNIIVTRFSGEDRVLEFIVGGVDISEYGVAGDSITGHPAVAEAVAVGAVNASNPGNMEIAPYSSRGPVLISHPTMELRLKPELVAIDAVRVSGAGDFPTRFAGTSAAAPHVAGVVALLLQAVPTATPAMIRAALQEGAIDLGEPGVDPTFGAGRLNARRAYLALTGQPLPDAGGDGGGGCFIATAIYGSALQPELQALRGVRDRYLLPYASGRILVGLYQRSSPPLADFLRRHGEARTAARWALMPMIYLMRYPLVPGVVAVAVFLAVYCRCRRASV